MPAPRLKDIKWDGKPISRPGMYAGIPIDVYHSAGICAGPSISSSGLREIAANEYTTEAYWATSPLNPERVEKKESRALLFGRAVHHLLLGEKFFTKLFAVQPETITDPKTGEIVAWNNNRTACREWHAKVRKTGRGVVLPAEMQTIVDMAKRLGKHPLVANGILNGKIERSLIWRDKETGIWIKTRPDSIPTDSADFADYKTTASILRKDLTRTLRDFGYHMQGALVREAARQVLGMEMSSFTLVFQEKADPFSVRDMRLKDNDLDRGALQNRLALRKLWHSLKHKDWTAPGHGAEGSEYLELPEREQTMIDEDLEFHGVKK